MGVPTIAARKYLVPTHATARAVTHAAAVTAATAIATPVGALFVPRATAAITAITPIARGTTVITVAMTPAGAANFEDFDDPHLALSSITSGLPGAPSQKGLGIYDDNRSYPKRLHANPLH
jgi:hypothetical protein